MKLKNAVLVESPFPNHYASEFLMLEKGKGVWLWDVKGRKYLDFTSGIAVNALGHGNRKAARIVKGQMKKLTHVSNLFTTRPAVELAEKMLSTGDYEAVHFGNSGSEANETALKFARIYSKENKGEQAFKILSFEGSFHGRTLGALAVTATRKYQKGYAPMPEGFTIKPFNDLSSLEVLDEDFAAVILEPLQGEGGLVQIDREFADALMKICKEKDILIIADEIQCGMGRTGTLYAYEQLGIQPDILTLSKPLAGGLPLSATLIPEKVNRCIHLGDHGTTFGGGPVTTALACYIWDFLSATEHLEMVKRKGDLLKKLLMELIRDLDLKAHVRGMGLLRGISLDEESQGALIPEVLQKAREKGLLILRAGSGVIRLAPALIVKEKELRKGVEILKECLKEIL